MYDDDILEDELLVMNNCYEDGIDEACDSMYNGGHYNFFNRRDDADEE